MKDDRTDPAHPRHRELMLPCCSAGTCEPKPTCEGYEPQEELVTPLRILSQQEVDVLLRNHGDKS